MLRKEESKWKIKNKKKKLNFKKKFKDSLNKTDFLKE